jgi:hypothetical protein
MFLIDVIIWYPLCSVPVVVIFTKFDARDYKAFFDLRSEGVSRTEAAKQAHVRSTADFEKECLGLLYMQKYPPKAHVYLRGKMLFLIST